MVPVHQIAGTPAGEFIGANTAREYATAAGEIPQRGFLPRPSEMDTGRW